MNDIHTCSYSCERPACIKAQRDELAARILTQPAAAQEAVAWRVGDEFYPSESLAIEAIQQWGPSGAIAIPLYAAAPVTAAWEAVGVDAYDDALDQLWKLSGGNDHPVYKRFLGFRDSFAAPAASPSEINLEQFREAVTYWRDTALQDMQYQNGPLHEQANEGQRLLALIDASPKGGSSVRAQFEAWLAPSWSQEGDTDEDGDFVYREDWVQGAWIGYQAAMLANPLATTPTPEG